MSLKNQGEIFKEQIKSGIQQEHLIHKDLINTRLEKLFKASEEKRRATNLLFNRHMTGLGFFLDNAHKHMGILNQAHADLLKNRDLVDYYGDVSSTTFSSEVYREAGSLFGSVKAKRQLEGRQMSRELGDNGELEEKVEDEELLADFS